MKNRLKSLIEQAVKSLQAEDILSKDLDVVVQIERTRDRQFGDFACNLAMALAKPTQKNPREIAKLLIQHLPADNLIQKVEIAGPGFINFTLVETVYLNIIEEILQQNDRFGETTFGKGQKVYIEYVSANPTGPLHVGHGRGAAYGACVSNILQAAGFDVHREYYVNDAGRQMRILALSTWLRYLQLCNVSIALPVNAYQGQYIIDIANILYKGYGQTLKPSAEDILHLTPKNIDPENDKETYIDAVISAAIKLIGEQNFAAVQKLVLNEILADIKADLAEFGVDYDEWFPESGLINSGLVTEGINLLREHGYVYEKDGAQWFKATSLGDEKDRVLIRANGQTTYFASDVAYHLHKYNSGANHVVDVFGADHHGYMQRIQAFLKGLGKDPAKLKILLVQFAILYRGKEKVSMSTRSGEFVTLRELRAEVGNDAARFFYIMRKPEQHLDFDLELAKSESSENPVYYIQYAHARICSIWRQLKESGDQWDSAIGKSSLTLLNSEYEKRLLLELNRYPEIIEVAAKNYEPHLLAHYLQELAHAFHTYYNAERFLVDDLSLKNARLCLVKAVQITLANGLKLLGVNAPQQM